MVRLIVHGDDLGISEAVNDGMRQAYRQGILTSTSIMATGRAFEHAVALCRSEPRLDVGVHLTLVEETPVLERHLIGSLVNENGHFYERATLVAKRYLAGKLNMAHVRRELNAQVQKVLDSGLKISHLDSHQHLHMLPQLLQVVVELADAYAIPAIRFPREGIRLYMLRDVSQVGRVVELVALNFFCLLNRKTTRWRTDHFAGFYFSGRLNKANLLRVLQNLPRQGTCELVCHPGQATVAQYDHWGYRWHEELEALTDPEVREFVEQRGIRLVSYGDLEPESNKPP